VPLQRIRQLTKYTPQLYDALLRETLALGMSLFSGQRAVYYPRSHVYGHPIRAAAGLAQSSTDRYNVLPSFCRLPLVGDDLGDPNSIALFISISTNPSTAATKKRKCQVLGLH
jgi:hypothetical protein